MNNVRQFGFTGSYLDPITGGYPLGNGYRLYLPHLMRFSAPDDWSPFGLGGINPYVYCDDDPINRLDPSGHGPNLETIVKLTEEDDKRSDSTEINKGRVTAQQAELIATQQTKDASGDENKTDTKTNRPSRSKREISYPISKKVGRRLYTSDVTEAEEYTGLRNIRVMEQYALNIYEDLLERTGQSIQELGTEFHVFDLLVNNGRSLKKIWAQSERIEKILESAGNLLKATEIASDKIAWWHQRRGTGLVNTAAELYPLQKSYKEYLARAPRAYEYIPALIQARYPWLRWR